MCCVGCVASMSAYCSFVKCGSSSGAGNTQRGCFGPSCCQESLEDDDFERTAREARLKTKQQDSSETETDPAVVDTQPSEAKEMDKNVINTATKGDPN